MCALPISLRYAVNTVFLNDFGRRFLDSEFVLGMEPRKGNRIENEAFVLDCSGADRNHPLCKGRTGTVGVAGTLSSRSSVVFDVDGDGDLDVITNEWNDRPRVMLSNLSQRRSVRRLEIRLVGVKSNRDGLGAMVQVRSRGKVQARFHDGKSGYLSQSSVPLYFGLGTNEVVEQIDVDWPSGTHQQITGPVSLDSVLRLVER